MTWGKHPAIAYDATLRVGQVHEARTVQNNTELRFRARIVKLERATARVESLGLDDRPMGEVFMIPRWPSGDWSPHTGLFPYHRPASPRVRILSEGSNVQAAEPLV
jgi:hypothetical protein